MKEGKKFDLLNSVGQYSIVLLSAAFIASFLLFVLPQFRSISAASAEQSWFLISWNIPGPLMFISVFRIHTLRVINEKISGKRNAMGITRWVRFWFMISVAFGVLSLAFLIVSNFGALPSLLALSSVGIVALWLALVLSTVALLKMKHGKEILKNIERYKTRERVLLALTSVVFLIFTGFSSIVLSLPV